MKRYQYRQWAEAPLLVAQAALALVAVERPSRVLALVVVLLLVLAAAAP
jgi:hypothetical protein